MVKFQFFLCLFLLTMTSTGNFFFLFKNSIKVLISAFSCMTSTQYPLTKQALRRVQIVSDNKRSLSQAKRSTLVESSSNNAEENGGGGFELFEPMWENALNKEDKKQ